jgi:hypothetical protein
MAKAADDCECVINHSVTYDRLTAMRQEAERQRQIAREEDARRQDAIHQQEIAWQQEQEWKREQQRQRQIAIQQEIDARMARVRQEQANRAQAEKTRQEAEYRWAHQVEYRSQDCGCIYVRN